MKNVIIQITSGRGPAECCWVVARVLKEFLREATHAGLSYEIIHREPGDENGTLKTASIRLEGNEIDSFLKTWLGTILWIGQSTFRKFHKRKNWFIGVNKLDSNEVNGKLLDADIRYEFTRAGGPGGQHVNKVSTAVRATHVPSGESVFVSQGRSQLQNKKEAKRRLLGKLEENQLLITKERVKAEWENHNQLNRGNPVRIFKGSDFKPNHHNKKYKSNRKKLKQDWLNRFDD
ncbi:MAG: peptide chain release factor H [Bacteroidota bacterium]